MNYLLPGAKVVSRFNHVILKCGCMMILGGVVFILVGVYMELWSELLYDPYIYSNGYVYVVHRPATKWF